MKTILKTDFIDVYDDGFDKLNVPQPHHQFVRMSKTSLSRGKALDHLRMNFIPTVEYGITLMMESKLKPDDLVVVYTDEYAHQGIGKELMTYGMAKSLYPDFLISKYLSSKKSVSIRELFIGRIRIELLYESDHEWKSNVGNVKISLLSTRVTGLRPLEQYALFSIDYVLDGENKKYAIDFDSAPLIKNTPIIDILSPKEISDELIWWFNWKKHERK